MRIFSHFHPIERRFSTVGGGGRGQGGRRQGGRRQGGRQQQCMCGIASVLWRLFSVQYSGGITSVQ